MTITDEKSTSTGTRRAGRREWIGLGVLALACVLYAMDLTVLHLAVPKLSAALQPTGTQLLWIVDIYGFLVAGSLITMGTLGDRLGRRRLLLIGASAFGATSVLAAFSTTPGMLIAARALMGIAGATLAPSTLSLIFNMFPLRSQRAVAIGVWTSAFSAGQALGPVLGGLLLHYFWWGSVFLLALPVMALLLLLGPYLLPEFRNPAAGHPDLRSVALSLVAMLAVIYGIKEIAHGGLSLFPALAIVAGVVAGLGFLHRQRNLANPLIELDLFRTRAFNLALATNVFAVFVAVGYFLFITQYLQLVLALSPLHAGLWTLPSAVAFIVGSNLTPRYIHRFRPAVVLGAALALAAIGLAVLTQAGLSTGPALIAAATVLISLALAPIFTLTTELIVGSAPPERAGGASALAETGSELGAALGIAILGSIGTAVYRSRLAADLPAGFPADAARVAADTLGAAAGAAGHLPGPLGATLLRVAQEAFVRGMHLVAVISAAVAVVAAIAILILLRHVPAGAAQKHQARSDRLAAPQPSPPAQTGRPVGD